MSEPIQTTYNIDFLTVSVYDEDLAARVGPLHTDGEWIPVKGMWGYDQGWQCSRTGVKRLRSSSRPDMGVCFTCSGKAINRIVQYTGLQSTIHALDSYGLSYGRASRIDLCVDYHDNGLLAYVVGELLEQGLIDSDAKKSNIVKGYLSRKNLSSTNGITTYIGSRTSPRFIRVYDKEAESRGLIPSTRFEMEAKADYAALLWRSLSGRNDPDVVRQAVKGSINAFVRSWGSETVDKIFALSEPWKPAPREETDSDLKAWLSRQVIPTLIRSYREQPNGENLFTWLNDAVSNRLHDDDI